MMITMRDYLINQTAKEERERERARARTCVCVCVCWGEREGGDRGEAFAGERDNRKTLTVQSKFKKVNNLWMKGGGYFSSRKV
jgi:hypothetical protein